MHDALVIFSAKKNEGLPDEYKKRCHSPGSGKVAAWKESLRIVIIIIVVRFLFDTGKNVKVDN